MRDRKFTRLQKILKIFLGAAIILFLAVLCFFLPFYALLPAKRLPQREEGELRLHLLSGVGDCKIVEFPSGKLLMINGRDGSLKSRNEIYRYVKGLNPVSVSLLATDANGSCVGGFVRILENFPVERAYLPAFSKETGSYAKFVSALQDRDVPAARITRYGAIADPSGAYAVCLSPYRTEEDASDASVVLWLGYGDVGIFLAGNTSSMRERRIYDEYLIDSTIFDTADYRVRLSETDIYVAPSHGARGGTRGELLQLLGAKEALVQCGRGCAPSSETMLLFAQEGLNVYRTDELDAVTVSIRNGAYRVIAHFGDNRRQLD